MKIIATTSANYSFKKQAEKKNSIITCDKVSFGLSPKIELSQKNIKLVNELIAIIEKKKDYVEHINMLKKLEEDIKKNLKRPLGKRRSIVIGGKEETLAEAQDSLYYLSQGKVKLEGQTQEGKKISLEFHHNKSDSIAILIEKLSPNDTSKILCIDNKKIARCSLGYKNEENAEEINHELELYLNALSQDEGWLKSEDIKQNLLETLFKKYLLR